MGTHRLPIAVDVVLAYAFVPLLYSTVWYGTVQYVSSVLYAVLYDCMTVTVPVQPRIVRYMAIQ